LKVLDVIDKSPCMLI